PCARATGGCFGAKGFVLPRVEIMQGKGRAGVLGVTLVVAFAAVWWVAAAPPSPQEQRDQSAKTMKAGNFKDAYEGFRKLALDPNDDRVQVGQDLEMAIQCLQHLGRSDEIDDFREGVIEVHKQNWRLRETAAQSLVNNEHYGFIVAGKFY